MTRRRAGDDAVFVTSKKARMRGPFVFTSLLIDGVDRYRA
jgi:hypothetical protein